MLGPARIRRLEIALVEEVCRARRELISGDRASGSVCGRLLAYAPDLSLADGAATEHSRGFFDVDNIPPWSTWVGMASIDDWDGPRYGVTPTPALISWVPGELVDLASLGVTANIERCLAWME